VTGKIEARLAFDKINGLPQEKLASMLGADAFLKRPFTAKQLFEMLEKLGF